MINRGLVKTRLGYIHYRRAGIGAPVMLFHINQQSSALMIELIEALASHLDVIAMDYPSHGRSDHVPDQPTIPDYAQVAGSMQTRGVHYATAAVVPSSLAGRKPR